MRLYENKFPLATARKDRLMERLVNEALTISFIENEGELNSKGLQHKTYNFVYF